ncbi:hypothetical protein [Roseovarius sp.]|uniref:hypothetical protein n=1 Tax=Roseovarius sp. TaxID=1486281 RepID=UPI003D0DF12A
MSSATQPGREVVQIVELIVPICANVFGTSPCTATGTGDQKCFNTRATCLDAENFDGSGTLSLFFSRQSVAERRIEGADYIIPSLRSVSTAPTKINLSAVDPDATGLGNRAVCDIELMDHPHTDRVVDPYLADRSYDPMARGSFWTKWLRRWKYRQNITVKVYEGYAGQALADMIKRQYVLIEVSGPDASGRVRLKGKDILHKLEERKAQCPEASPGVLRTALLAGAKALAVAGASLSDYPASGLLRIGDEFIAYSALSGVDGVLTFTVSERGAENTVAADHDAEAAVQLCKQYTAATVQEIVEDLLTTHAGIDPAMIDSAGSFAQEVSRHLSSYRLNTIISDPVAVNKLIAELQAQCGFFIWWDERVALIKMRAIRGLETEPPTLTERDHIMPGLSVSELPRNRVSQAWVYFSVRDWTQSLDAVNFRQVQVVADLASESEDRHGDPSIRKYFSRWLPTGNLAFSSGFKIVNRYSEIPSEAGFQVDAKDGHEYWVGDVFYLSHGRLVDAHGAPVIEQWTVVSADEVVPGETVEYVVENTQLYGRVYEWMADDAGVYPGTSAEFAAAYWGDSDGLLSDGTKAATWG